MHNIINLILVLLVLLLWIVVIAKLVLSKFAPTKTISAEICDKYIKNSALKHYGTFKGENYIVVFSTAGGKLSFNVSKYSYDNYRLNDKGTLKYKGRQIISFE